MKKLLVVLAIVTLTGCSPSESLEEKVQKCYNEASKTNSREILVACVDVNITKDWSILDGNIVFKDGTTCTQVNSKITCKRDAI